MNIIEIEDAIDELLHEKLFSAIRQMIVAKQNNVFTKGSDYLGADAKKRKELIKQNY